MYLSLKNRVRIKLTDEEASALAKHLMSNDVKWISVAGNFISVSEISSIETDDIAKEAQMLQQGKWKCWKGNWHGKNDICKCERSINYGERLEPKKEEGINLNGSIKNRLDYKGIVKKF